MILSSTIVTANNEILKVLDLLNHSGSLPEKRGLPSLALPTLLRRSLAVKGSGHICKLNLCELRQ